jgi:drug/metabolite transporter (DMT)-like permease
MLLSTLSFSLVNLCVKILADKDNQFDSIQNYPVHELVFFRSIISLSICIYVIRRLKIPFFGHNKKWLFARGIFGAISLELFFYTLQHLPMAIATSVQYLSPVFTVIFAIFMNKEIVRPIQWLFFAVSLSGILVIGFSKTETVSLDPFWLMVGVFSAVSSGLAYNSIIKCKDTDAPITVVMYFPLITTPVMMVISMVYGFVTPQGIEWLLLLAMGILTQIAQISMTKAFNSDNASRITPVKYIGAIYAGLIGFFIFDETLGLYAGLGISLVLGGVLLNTFLTRKVIHQSSKV